MNEINVFKEVDEEVKELSVMKEILEYACKKEKLSNIQFNVIIVDNNYIHKINKEYRGIDKETEDIRILGDIYISIDKVKEQAKEFGHSEKRELCFLAVHGFYHLLGYDHMTKEEEEVMFKKQEEVLEDYGITR